MNYVQLCGFVHLSIFFQVFVNILVLEWEGGSGLMVSALVSKSSGLGSSPVQVTLLSWRLSPRHKWLSENLMLQGNPLVE